MYPPIYTVCAAVAAVKAVLGTGPTRLYPFGDAPQDVALPYAVWSVIGGNPENLLGEVPDVDRFLLQVDVYAETVTEAREAAEALRDAIETEAYVVSWSGESTDPETRRKRYSFDAEWHVQR